MLALKCLPLYSANPKRAAMPPAKIGVPYSRAIARAVAAPVLAPADWAPVDDAEFPPLVREAVPEADAPEVVAASVVRLPHLLSLCVVHWN